MRRPPYHISNCDDPVEYLVRPAYSGGIQPIIHNSSQVVCRSFVLTVEVELAGQMLSISIKVGGI
ncbi:hypothetical protein SD208_08465 [Ochrobactrum sp. BD67]|nr:MULTISPECIES: hypothetical protein [unclassified Ochrobactrum]MBA8843541.1 hypothetical protein [Ochrobactrum sp. RH1CCR137]MBA8855729.1 hypothetical protein [Ochrobactrum sp. RH1CCR134]